MDWQLSVTAFGCGEGRRTETWPERIEVGELMLAKKSWQDKAPDFIPWKEIQRIGGCKVSLIYADNQYKFTVAGRSPVEVKKITEVIDWKIKRS